MRRTEAPVLGQLIQIVLYIWSWHTCFFPEHEFILCGLSFILTLPRDETYGVEEYPNQNSVTATTRGYPKSLTERDREVRQTERVGLTSP